MQYAEEDNDSLPHDKEQTKYTQVVDYGRAFNNTILPALSAIATKQSKPAERTKEKVQQLLDYCATKEEAIISYKASKMILAIDSDVGYCNEKNHKVGQGDIFHIK